MKILGKYLNPRNNYFCMNKRGQVYLIAALMLSVVIFLLVSQTNFVQRILFEDDFEQIAKNFDIESAKFMNSVLVSEVVDILGQFRTFTKKFSDYVEVENPEFEFVFAIDYKGETYLGYYIKDDIWVGATLIKSNDPAGGSISGDDMSLSITPRGEGLVIGNITDFSTIIIKDMEYILNIQEGVPQIIVISREEKGQQVKVFLNKEFIEGRRVTP